MVDEEDLGRPDGGEEPLEGVAAVELAEEGSGGEVGEEGRDVGEEVEGVAEEHRLKSGDCPHLRPIREDLCFLSDCSVACRPLTERG